MRQRLNIDDDTFVFGSIGSLIPRKANHHTLEALAQFSQRHPQAKWKMVLVGEGAERGALAAQADALGIAEHVILPVSRTRLLTISPPLTHLFWPRRAKACRASCWRQCC